MLKRNMRPAHPGAILNGMIEGLREESGQAYTITEIAEGLGTASKTLSAIINGKQSVTPEMAIRLGTAFANTTPEFWLTVQKNHDLAQARRKVDISSVTVFWKPASFLQASI